ncbi:MAG: head decoration protein [Pseudomonadota bacterium]
MTTETYAPGDMIVGDHPILTEVVTITGADLERGAVLGIVTANDKHELAAGQSNGAETPAAILATDANAASADVEATVYLTGEFDASKLIFGAGQTAATLNKAMRTRGQSLRAVTPS